MCEREGRVEAEASLSMCSDEDRPWRKDEAKTAPMLGAPLVV